MARLSFLAALPAREAGQASPEYLAGLVAFVLVLIALPDNPVVALLNAFKQFWTNFSFIISTP